MKITAKSVFGDVIGCGSHTPGEQHDIGPFKGDINCPDDVVAAVTNRGDGHDDETPLRELTSHPYSIGVYNLSDQQLVSNRNNLYPHIVIFGT